MRLDDRILCLRKADNNRGLKECLWNDTAKCFEVEKCEPLKRSILQDQNVAD